MVVTLHSRLAPSHLFIGIRTLCRNSRSGISPLSGVMLDNKRRWSPHIEMITSKAKNVLGLIKRNLWNCPKSVKETAYTTLVRPKLQYACSAWDTHHQKAKAALERVQRKAARFVTENYDRSASMTAMLQDQKWDTLEAMRRHTRLSTMFKMCHGFLDGNFGGLFDSK